MSDTKDLELVKEQANELIAILEIMPEDIGTLNSLVYTYLELENLPRAEDYASKLIMALDATGDKDMAPDYIQQYIDLAPESQTFVELLNSTTSTPSVPTETPNNEPGNIDDLEAQLAQLEDQESQFNQLEETESTSDSIIKIEDSAEDIATELNEFALQLTAELELADFLKSKNVITDTQAESAVSSLIENSLTEKSLAPLTFLNELNLIEHIDMDKVLSELSKNESTPFVKVNQFKVSDSLRNIIRPTTAKKLGIVIFSTFMDELLIATSNPLDFELKQGLEQILQRKIHFYITSPDEVNNFYDS